MTTDNASASTVRSSYAKWVAIGVLAVAAIVTVVVLMSGSPAHHVKAANAKASYHQGYAIGALQAKVPANIVMTLRGFASADSICAYYSNHHSLDGASYPDWLSGCVHGFVATNP